MIDTKEQYEAFKKLIGASTTTVFMEEELNLLIETIEALREVARLGRKMMGSNNLVVEDYAEWDTALDALSDWLLE